MSPIDNGRVSEPTEIELDAVRLRWRSIHPDAPEGAGPSESEIAELLPETRQRAAAVEAKALAMLRRATRNDWSRSGSRSRYAQAFFLWIILPIVILFVVVSLINMIGWR